MGGREGWVVDDVSFPSLMRFGSVWSVASGREALAPFRPISGRDIVREDARSLHVTLRVK